MKRTTVKLPDDLDARLRHEAQRRGMTVSELTREAIAAHLGIDASAPGSGRRRFFSTAAGHDGGHERVSERVEEIIRAEVDHFDPR
jgi:predicted transcriptional regulator